MTHGIKATIFAALISAACAGGPLPVDPEAPRGRWISNEMGYPNNNCQTVVALDGAEASVINRCTYNTLVFDEVVTGSYWENEDGTITVSPEQTSCDNNQIPDVYTFDLSDLIDVSDQPGPEYKTRGCMYGTGWAKTDMEWIR